MRLAIALLIGALSVGCARVGPGYVGIKISMAGSDRGVDEIPTTTGWVFYNPLATSIFEYPTFVQQVVLEGDEEVTFSNADQMRIGADISFGYHLEAAKVPEFYVKFRNDDLNHFTHGYLRSLIRDKFTETAGRYRIEQIMGEESGKFLAEVKAAVQKDVTHYGVVIEDQFGFVRSPRPPQSVVESIDAKARSVQVALQTENEVKTAEAEGKKRIAKANADATTIATIANAEAEANRKLAESITPNLLELKRLEKWNGILPTVTGGVTPFFNIK